MVMPLYVSLTDFESIINSLDEIIHNENDPKLMDIRTQLLELNVLFLLLLGDVFQPINRFSRFLQTRNLVFDSVNAKLNQLMESLRYLKMTDHILKRTQKAFFILHTTV